MKNILLTLLLMILLLLGIEVLFRVIQSRYIISHLSCFDRSAVYFQVDEERLHPWSHLAENSRSIAVVGDSFTRGAGVQLTDRFAAILERMLNVNRDAMPFKVEVLALPGTSTFQQINLARSALELEPELVILAICLNDTEDWTRPDELEAWRSRMIPRRPPRILERFFSISRLSGWAYGRIQSIRTRQGYLSYYRNLYDPSYSGWKRFAAALKIIRDACRDEEVDFLVLIFPLLSDRFEQGHYPFEFAHQAIHELLARESINFVDALERFRNTCPLRMTAIPVIDPHPSEIAHRIAAETLFDYLLDIGLLDREYLLRWRETEVELPQRWRRAAREMGLPLELNRPSCSLKGSAVPR